MFFILFLLYSYGRNEFDIKIINRKGSIVIKKLTLILACAFVFSGCSVKPAKVVFQAPENTKAINVYSVIQQSELEALYPISSGGSAVGANFGLVGALVGGAIDASITSANENTATKNLVAIRKELEDLDFDSIFAEEIVKKLENNVHVGEITTLKSNNINKDDFSLNDLYLVLDTSYKMDIDFRTPFIVTEVVIKERSNKRSLRKDKKLYKNTFTFFGNSLPIPVNNISQEDVDKQIAQIKEDWANKPKSIRKDKRKKKQYQRQLIAAKKLANSDLSFDQANAISAKSWSTKYKEQLKANLRQGIQSLLSIIASDINDKTDPTEYKDQGITLAGYPAHHKSVIVDEDEKVKVIRFTEGARAGAICAMPAKLSTEKLVCL